MIFQYDASAEKCPLPLVNLRLILNKMTINDVCVIKICDVGSKESIPKLLTKLGYHFHQSLIDINTLEITISKEN